MHRIIALGVALPFLILWGIGIPAAVWFLMTKEKERMNTVAIK
jgi:hypothetical protein